MTRAFLGVLVLGLSGLLVYQWYGWTLTAASAAFLQVPSSQSDDDSVAGSGSLPSLARLGSLDDFAIISERPLFNKDRRPIEKPANGSAAGFSRDRPSLTVSAIVAVQDDYYAHVRTSEGELLRLAPDDEYQGWRVGGILFDRLVLLRDERREEFELRPFPEAVTKDGK